MSIVRATAKTDFNNLRVQTFRIKGPLVLYHLVKNSRNKKPKATFSDNSSNNSPYIGINHHLMDKEARLVLILEFLEGVNRVKVCKSQHLLYTLA